ncbi:MAG: thioredoxin family protein [Myxococcales bacterium]
MGTLMTFLGIAVGSFFLLLFGMQIAVRLKARAQTGKAVPTLSGPLGQHVGRGRRALVYFHSPGCGACRPLTPRLKEMSQQSESVFLVDVSEETDTARALQVMATPSFVEIDSGKIVGYHVGMAPSGLLARYSA